MKVVALVESEDHVCCRYRVAAFRPFLERAGYDLVIHALPKSLARRVPIYRVARAADAVIVQRKLLRGLEVALLRRWTKTLIFDYDDAVWLRDSYSPKGFDSLKRSARFWAVARVADAVFAGNDYLAEYARRYAPADRVAVIPTCVDPAAYPVADGNSTDPVRLVWVGSASTLKGLDRFRDTLEQVGRAVPGVRLKLICDKFLEFDHLPVDCVQWAETTEAGEIAAADIGIGWVPDDPWSRGKCGLKILQYQAAGLPVIANPVGVQAAFVRDGVTGFQAETPEQWVAAVRTLAGDAALRRALGAAGRRQIEEQYSVAAGARLWVEQLDRLCRPTAVNTPG
ncbi:glycosyltransferase family 4 protein [Fimbriiglobus ruber]|uniref:Glycosyl transferase, group 1 n=1 Tax=Fimbriiglobus ruber TaxID=1908690 RepID=A0A225DQY4_9BACT|nr:glycosyltransferase family 4 protein [Fimbriiglobus ruber]OWK43890.1 Glycosyl transferase, group 1 [Fimbriiglobus ruber]